MSRACKSAGNGKCRYDGRNDLSGPVNLRDRFEYERRRKQSRQDHARRGTTCVCLDVEAEQPRRWSTTHCLLRKITYERRYHRQIRNASSKRSSPKRGRDQERHLFRRNRLSNVTNTHRHNLIISRLFHCLLNVSRFGFQGYAKSDFTRVHRNEHLCVAIHDAIRGGELRPRRLQIASKQRRW